MLSIAAWLVAALLAGCLPPIPPPPPSQPPVWEAKTITTAGSIHPLPDAAYQPDPNATYKVVFGVTKAADKPFDVSPSLEAVARAVNLYVNAGVPLTHLKFVVVIYGGATPIALDDAHYKQKFGGANPNLPVLAQLHKAGIDVVVCGQAWAGQKFDSASVDPDVRIALSALTTITELEQGGYSLMPL